MRPWWGIAAFSAFSGLGMRWGQRGSLQPDCRVVPVGGTGHCQAFGTLMEEGFGFPDRRGDGTTAKGRWRCSYCPEGFAVCKHKYHHGLDAESVRTVNNCHLPWLLSHPGTPLSVKRNRLTIAREATVVS